MERWPALTLWQPWAQLCVITDTDGLAAKQVETRSRNSKHRGWVFIHASASNMKANAQIARSEPFSTILRRHFKFYGDGYTMGRKQFSDNMPRGAIIGMVYMTESFQFGGTRSKDYLKSIGYERGLQEVAFGDWTAGRYGYLFERHMKFKEPIPCAGQLGMWYPDAVYPQILEAIEAVK